MSETESLSLAFLAPTAIFPLPLPILVLNKTTSTTPSTPTVPITIQQFALAVYAQTGSNVSQAGISQYNTGTVVSVTVTPLPGYKFVEWQLDGADIGTANPISITMNQNHLLVAVISAINTVVIPNAITEILESPIFGPPALPTAVTEMLSSPSVSFK